VTRSAEEKMFRVLLMLGADILESVNALKIDAGIVDEDEDLQPLFTPEMLRYSQYDHSVDDLYAMVELVDTGLDVPLHIDPLTARAFRLVHTLKSLIYTADAIDTDASREALAGLDPLFPGVRDDPALHMRMRFLIADHREFPDVFERLGLARWRDREFGRSAADYETLSREYAGCGTDGYGPTEAQFVAFCDRMGSMLTPIPKQAPMDPAIARSMFMRA
jgi:hypothetical protein